MTNVQGYMNISQVADELAASIKRIASGQFDYKQEEALANACGKHINVFKTQLAYHALRDEAPTIPYLAAESARPRLPTKQAPAPLAA